MRSRDRPAAGDSSAPGLRSHVLHDGIRFPLGWRGLAILAHLPLPEAEGYVRRRGADLATGFGAPHDVTPLLRRVAATRRLGHAVNRGCSCRAPGGHRGRRARPGCAPVWALRVAGVQARLAGDRIAEPGGLLLDAAHALSQRLGRR